MKKNYRTILVLAAITATTLSFYACSKYDESDGITLSSKQKRLVQDWTLQEYIPSTTVATSTEYSELQYVFEDDGSFSMTGTSEDSVMGATYTIITDIDYSGTWVWKNNKEDIEVSVLATDIDYEVKKLSSDELKLIDDFGNEFVFVK